MQTFKQRYLCLSAQTYRIEPEENGQKTGEIIEGITIRYIPSDDLTPCEDEQAVARGQVARGIKAAKLSLPMSAVIQLNVFPALYDMELEMAVVADKLQVRAKGIEFVGAVKIEAA